MMNYNDFFDKTKQIYDWLEDDLSRAIYTKRLEFSCFQNTNIVSELAQNASPYVQNTMSQQKKSQPPTFDKNETIIIYGAGAVGKSYYDLNKATLSNNEIFFCDKNFEEIKFVDGIEVISPDVLIKKHSTNKIVVGSISCRDQIFNFLISNNIPEDRIYFANYIVDPGQYFDPDIIKLNENEVFVDAGVYDGDTSLQFAKAFDNKYKKIYMLEADPKQISMIEPNIKNLKNAELINIGLWDCETTLQFDDTPNVGGMITESGGNCIKVNALDNICNKFDVTFIKMDIEGAELNALMGAKETIMKNRPKLAISIYHKPEDIITIPMYIKSIVPEYKFYIRHYSNLAVDTILYAVV